MNVQFVFREGATRNMISVFKRLYAGVIQLVCNSSGCYYSLNKATIFISDDSLVVELGFRWVLLLIMLVFRLHLVCLTIIGVTTRHAYVHAYILF